MQDFDLRHFIAAHGGSYAQYLLSVLDEYPELAPVIQERLQQKISAFSSQDADAQNAILKKEREVVDDALRNIHAFHAQQTV